MKKLKRDGRKIEKGNENKTSVGEHNHIRIKRFGNEFLPTKMILGAKGLTR